MREDLQIWIKKLALAYETGWEYVPGSEEPGSVLMDIFLEMAEENQKRFQRIWERQERVFLQVVPETGEESGGGKGALLVKVSEEEDGKWLEEGTEAYMFQEEGQQVRFYTACSVQLTSAKLKYAIYRRGLCAWLTYEKKAEEQGQIPLFQPMGEVLSHPVFRWRFRGLCDGRKEFCFQVDFAHTESCMEMESGGPENHVKLEGVRREGDMEMEDDRPENRVEVGQGREKYPEAVLPGTWTISDGKNTYPAEWQQTTAGFLLTGQTPEFAQNLTGELYEICLEVTAQEELTTEWLAILCGDIVLTEAPEEKEPDICLTDFGAGGGGKVLPFGTSLEEADCCYLACDSIMAGEKREITLRFREGFQEEEKLPEPRPEEYKKLYKKYPWLQFNDTVQEWQVEDTTWEYFNGNLWRNLPDSEKWQTLCEVEKTGERICRWMCPEDMQPCAVEGEVHLYIRLRLSRVRNAYALYYRKAIPVLEEIRFGVGERRMAPVERILPDCTQAKEENMYLGFDRAVTADDCWYTGEDCCSFLEEQIRGWDIFFGKEAFWVELREKKAENLSCLLPNYVPILQGKEQRETKYQISAETDFSVEPGNMGILEAVCVGDIRCGGTGAPILLEKQASEHYFMHFGKLLTTMDMEMILQERYPFLKVGVCTFQQAEKKLTVEIVVSKEQECKENIHTMWEEAQSRLSEIQEWLEVVVAKRGPIWLQDCCVSCQLQPRKIPMA